MNCSISGSSTGEAKPVVPRPLNLRSFQRRGSGEAPAARRGRAVCSRWYDSGVEPSVRGWILDSRRWSCGPRCTSVRSMAVILGWESESRRGSVRLPGRKFQSHPAVPPGRLIEEKKPCLESINPSNFARSDEYIRQGKQVGRCYSKGAGIV